MNKRIWVIIVTVFAVCVSTAKAQDNVYDIITLKDGKGVVKGFMNEQELGQSVSIIPTEATVRIDFRDISVFSNKKSIKKDSIGVEVDHITLKNGQTIEGEILETAPDKWVVIRTVNLPSQTYKLDDVAKIGKSVHNPQDNIFEEYGVLDVLITKDNTMLKGAIIEQTFGETVKIKTIDKGVLVYDIAEITTAKREAFDPSKDIFKQSAFLDILSLKNGTVIKGIIIQQTPGKEIHIETIGNSRFTQKYADVVKLSKEINPYKENSSKTKNIVKEPDSVGIYLYNDSSMNRPINAYAFKISRNRDFILLEEAPFAAIDKFKNNTELSFLVRINGNVDDIMPTVKILDVAVNKKKRTKYIPIPETKENILDILSDNQENETLKVEKYGKSSMKITFTPRKAGEYAVIFKGCSRITVFGIE